MTIETIMNPILVDMDLVLTVTIMGEILEIPILKVVIPKIIVKKTFIVLVQELMN